MTQEREIPADALSFTQEQVRGRRILWTYHVNMRLEGRFVPRRAVLDAVEKYEIVEAYPEDKYLPSYLVLARHGHEAFHILFATDVEGKNVRIVTVYRPDPQEWGPDLRTRRRPR